MKQYFTWLKTECKRVVCGLPSVLLGAMVLAGMTGILVFGGHKIMGRQREMAEAVIAVSTPADQMTELAVSFIGSMDSVRDWCRFEKMDLESALKQLAQGEVLAVISLPEQVVEHILDGTNVPAVLYFREDMPGSTLLFEELARAGVSLLETAQAEIYAADELQVLYGIEDDLAVMYRDINRYNLYLALDREKLFQVRTLSATGSTGLFAYYAGAGLALFMFCIGMTLPEEWGLPSVRGRLLRTKGIGSAGQFMGYWWILSVYIGIWTLLVAAGLRVLGSYVTVGQSELGRSGIKGLLAVFAASGCAAVMILLCRLLLRGRRAAGLGLGLGGICMGFLSGCFIPQVLLPLSIQRIGAYLPMTYMRELLSRLF